VSVIRLVVNNDTLRSQDEVDRALMLADRGLPAAAIARLTGIPRSTIRDWRNGRQPHRSYCSIEHAPERLADATYAYLLGMYLGDGYLSAKPRGVWHLRITLDANYPGVVSECASAVEAISRRKVNVRRRRDSRAVVVSGYWKHWACVFPQHGAGRKHTRRIALTAWQEPIVSANAEQFLRGLIHSDGTRIIATERKGSYVRRAPRYCFSNRSEDILQLFRAACEATGVHCTRSSRAQISVYRKEAVARLDEFVGPKQ
jgi:hypothetical protein